MHTFVLLEFYSLYLMRNHWWKILAIVLIIYSFGAGLLGAVPKMAIVRESIRNLYYHLPMWFTMMTLFSCSFIFSVRYLFKLNSDDDIKAGNYAGVGVFFGFLGITTGMVWANYTWGVPWNNDPKQIGAGLCILSYLAYMVLRRTIQDREKAAKVSAVYNIFAFALMIPFIYILPDVLGDSLHPGAGGNVGFSDYDNLDNRMRKVLYPGVIGWILVGVWLSILCVKYTRIKNNVEQLILEQ